MKFSIITPCFNSTKTLRRTYESLCNQTFKDFEWILIDDGSTDATKALILALKDEAPFKVQYKFLDQNYFGSKSVYTACTLAQGEYACILDHDDELTPDAIEYVHSTLEKFKEVQNLAGVCGRCINENGVLVGPLFPFDEKVSNEAQIRFKYKNTSELFQFTKVELIKPWFEKMKPGYTNGFVWSNLSLNFSMIYTNKILRVYDTSLETSYSNSKTMIVRNPKEKAEAMISALIAYKDYLTLNPLFTLKMISSIVRHKINAKESVFIEQEISLFVKALNLAAIPLGYLKQKGLI